MSAVSNLPIGVFSHENVGPRVGMRLSNQVIDLAMLLGDASFSQPSLNQYLAQGPDYWAETDERVVRALARSNELTSRAIVDAQAVQLHRPIEVADYVDFFSSLEHATNTSRILRPSAPALRPNWREMPVGYHGRAGTVVVSGTEIRRPYGQLLAAGQRPRLAATERLDVEVELGFVVGVGSVHGEAVDVEKFDRHVFGVVLLLDWSARDIQAFEYQPLGPFLAKSFATSVSPWVVPLAALRSARVAPPERTPEPLSYLREQESWSLDIDFELDINETVVSRPNSASMYWTGAQQMAHLTVNGASLRTGDLYGSGTISSFERSGQGSLLELTENGSMPVRLADGSERGYLHDGDVVTVRARTSVAGANLDLGEVHGRIMPAAESDANLNRVR